MYTRIGWLEIVVLGATLAYGAALYAAPGEMTPLQGLRNNTLVAGKTTAFRLYVDDETFQGGDAVNLAILRPDGTELVRSFPRAAAVAIANPRLGPSLVIRVAGSELQWVGPYRVLAQVRDAKNGRVSSFRIDRMLLLPTKDVVVAIDRVNAGDVNPGTAAELQAAREAIERVAWMWPVRDGIDAPDRNRSAGLRYVVNNRPQGYGCDGDPKHSDCQLCPFLASWSNRPANVDSIHAGVAFRFQDHGESMGGIAPTFCPNQSIGWASVVMNTPVVSGWAQEIGHVFGLEDTSSPHYETNPAIQAKHSKDTLIDTAEADAGFDIQFNRAFPSSVYDAMHQVACACPADQNSYSSFDWEFLRRQFLKLNSTGPSLPTSFTSSFAPSAAGAGSIVYFFAVRSDGRIFSTHAALGRAGTGWSEVEGNGHAAGAPASAAVGMHVFTAIRAQDGQIYMNQADAGGQFGQWLPRNFRSNYAPALAAVKDRIFLFATGLDGRVYLSQAVLGQAFSPWFEVQGGAIAGGPPSAAAIGGHVFVAIRANDGRLLLNQADLGKAFGGWFPLNLQTDQAPGLASVADRIFVFAKDTSGRVLLKQALLGQAFSEWFEVQGGARTRLSPSAASVGRHVFVLVTGADGRVFINQTDLGSAFGQWLP